MNRWWRLQALEDGSFRIVSPDGTPLTHVVLAECPSHDGVAISTWGPAWTEWGQRRLRKRLVRKVHRMNEQRTKDQARRTRMAEIGRES